MLYCTDGLIRISQSIPSCFLTFLPFPRCDMQHHVLFWRESDKRPTSCPSHIIKKTDAPHACKIDMIQPGRVQLACAFSAQSQPAQTFGARKAPPLGRSAG